jgi:hypothetical protein
MVIQTHSAGKAFAQLLIVLMGFAFAPHPHANPYTTTASYTVSSTGSGVTEPGTLPWAVQQANY